jgi:hypothetical protein
MDLSQDIALAYIIAQGWIPKPMAYEVSTQQELSVSGDEWIEVAERCKKELEMEMESYKQRIEEREASRREFRSSGHRKQRDR